ncbi:ABC-type multidrug transport system, ATPase and permease component [Pseudobacteriovorax antillogorgiicola]|uniref:ABC-type multidrug transport system, ATPase and permease component n=1 Tax=Pseudobacteriovorax antillogorgiicola TaxID=1513793 RepID=A0A1Y6CMR0_9BACT|nr:ABC-type multidrug transport system fused ATPase/permease subunit [Pseudobacteriovorax antillogorgiicola]SMF75679.1 ABC-type multidrug transport system, ATPase and permease component [Pseudobacteriovorax antillogorgiicola]
MIYKSYALRFQVRFSVIKSYFWSVTQMLRYQGLVWFSFVVLSGLLLSTAEYSIAIFLQIFLTALGLVEARHIPEGLRFLTNYSMSSIIICLIGIGAIRSLGQFLSTRSPVKLGAIIKYNLQHQILTYLTSQKQLTLSEGEFMGYFTDSLNRTSVMIVALAKTTIAIIQCLLLLAGLIAMAWKQTLVGLTLIILIGFVSLYFNRKILKYSPQMPAIYKNMMETIGIVMKNWLYLRVVGMEREQVRKAISHAKLYLDHHDKAMLNSAISVTLPSFLGVVAIAFLVQFSLEIGTDGSIILAFLYIFTRLVQQLSSVVGGVNALTNEFPSFQIAMRYFSLSQTQPIEESEAKRKSVNIPPSIVIKDMSFSWEKNVEPIYRDYCLEIQAGSIVGIMGESGCGKSTLLQLILGQIEPSKGSLYVAGKPAVTFAKESTRSIAYVGPDPYLFDGTVRDNLCFGLDEVPSDIDIWEALEKAEISSRIVDLDERFDRHREKFSTGEKQRLAIARALLRSPKLLILDEASANLDHSTESHLALTIRKFAGDCTIIMVSHRKNFLKYCNEVIDLGAS